MITPNLAPWQPTQWQSELSSAFRRPEELLAFLDTQRPDVDAANQFSMLVPKSFAKRMRPGDPRDPLLLQVLPVQCEALHVDGFSDDPLGEADEDLGFAVAPGLIRKYRSRALMITTPGCAINCRYCFRRHFPYQEHRPKSHAQALAAIAADAQITEVILSGGDPLLLNDRALAELLREICTIEHVKRIRLHSRIPVVLPSRVTEDLLDTLNQQTCDIVMVIHCNHAQELDAQTAQALALIHATGTVLLNQSVLLQGINDDAAILCELSESLFDQGVMPYYLHMPDRVKGTSHFFVEDERAVGLHHQMQSQLSGYLVPRLVREVAGASSKVIVRG